MENMECSIIKVHASVILIKPFHSSQQCPSESYQKKWLQQLSVKLWMNNIHVFAILGMSCMAYSFSLIAISRANNRRESIQLPYIYLIKNKPVISIYI